MKTNNSLIGIVFLILSTLFSCTSNKNDEAFLKKVEGRYLFSADETVTVYAKDNVLLLQWRGAQGIKPSKIDDNIFFVKEMNAKIQFLTNPEDKKEYLVFVPKKKEDNIEYIHRKMNTGEKIPSEHLASGNYEKALEGYLAIKAKDSMSPLLNYRNFDRKGLRYQDTDSLELAMDAFKLNIALHPQNSDVYARLGNTYLKSKDTVNALTNYTKALEFDSGNRHIKRKIEKLQGKEVDNNN